MKNNIYIFALLADFLVGLYTFLLIMKATEMGANNYIIGDIGAFYGLAYFLSSLIASKIVTELNANRLIVYSCAFIALCGLCLLIEVNYYLFLIYALLFGFGSALFFITFQIFMKTNNNPLIAAGNYTFSWSIGMAFGFFLSGILISWSFYFSSFLIVIIALLVGIGLLHQSKKINDINTQEIILNKDYNLRNFTFIGWLLLITTIFFALQFRVIFPKMAYDEVHLSSAQIGFILFIGFLGQAVFSSIISRIQSFFFKIDFLILINIIGIISAVIFWFGNHLFHFIIAAICFGIFSGFCWMSAVFYSIIDEKRMVKNVSINEQIVGIITILSPFLGGIIAESGLRQPFFWLIIIIIFINLFQYYFTLHGGRKFFK